MIQARTRMRIALFVLSACALACADDASKGLQACDGERCSDECLSLSGPPCDVLAPSCQTRTFAAAQCVRGTEGEQPTVRIVTEEELTAELTEDAGTAAADAGVSDAAVGDASAAKPVDDSDTYVRGLELLGLYSNTPEPEDTVRYVAGYYQSETRSITLVDRGSPQNSDSSVATLAHEFVHALQDQEVGLNEFARASGRTTDAILAHGCLIEGEARMYEELASELLQGLSVDLDAWELSLERQAKYVRDAVAEDDSAYDQLWLLRYSVGARFLRDAWLAGGNAAVRDIFDAPPVSTLYWMLGYQDSKVREAPLSKPLACVDATAPSGFEHVRRDTLGAFGLYAFLSQNVAKTGPTPNRLAWELAKTWRQDAVDFFEDESGEVAVSWRLRFLDAEVAREIESLLKRNSVLGLRIKRRGDALELLATSAAGGMIKGWSGTDPDHCPVEE